MKIHQRKPGMIRNRRMLGILVATLLSVALWAMQPTDQHLHAQARDVAPTFDIISPIFSGNFQGPVGTFVNVKSTSAWTHSATIILSVEPEGTVCDPTTATPITLSSTTITVDGSGNWSAAFPWPNNANQAGAYHVCANEAGGSTLKGTSTHVFTVLTSQNGQPSVAPAITLSTPTVHSGDTITVAGTNWLPSQAITLTLQFPDRTIQQDPGEVLGTVNSDSSGAFSKQVTIPADRQSLLVVTAYAGTADAQNNFPLLAHSGAITVGAAPTVTPPPPTATIVPTKGAVSSTSTGGSSTQSSSGGDSTKILIALLGLIAAVLLGAGIVVAILAVRGKNGTPPQSGNGGAEWANNGPRNPQQGWDAGYQPGTPWDETQTGSPPGWNNEGWQQPPGQPWGGRESRPYRGPMPPNTTNAFDEDEDDPYRTRMGEPFQPPASRPAPGGPPPISRPASGIPPRSPSGNMQRRPPPADPNTYWDEGDTPDQPTNPGWPQNPPPHR